MGVRDWLRSLGGWMPAATGLPSPHAPGMTATDALLQFPNSWRRAKTDVVIGLDFGTSSAKVALQSPFKLGGRAVLVDFGVLAHPTSRFLLPACVHLDSEDRIQLEPPRPLARVALHLKLPLLDRTLPESDYEAEGASRELALAAGYLALTLREARRFFLATQKSSYETDEISWSLNLGIPSAGYDDDQIRRRFERLAKAAWRLSTTANHPSVADAVDAIQDAGATHWSDIPIEVVPEVAAQVVGYAKSRQRRDGLHLMLDMGASTLDVCAFVLHQRNGDDNYELLTAVVERLGMLELHSRRSRAANGRPPFDGVPSDIVNPLPDWHGVGGGELPLERLGVIDAEFVAECVQRVVFRTLFDLHQRRDPNSPNWETGIPVFVCGGGSTARVVDEMFARADAKVKKNWNRCSGLKRQLLPLPESLAAPNEPDAAEFGRYAVAYGLSFPAINIGTIGRPSEISDIAREGKHREWKWDAIDKDSV